MKHEALETAVKTAIAGELPLLLGMSGVELDPTASRVICDDLTKRVCDAVVARDLVRTADE